MSQKPTWETLKALKTQDTKQPEENRRKTPKKLSLVLKTSGKHPLKKIKVSYKFHDLFNSTKNEALNTKTLPKKNLNTKILKKKKEKKSFHPLLLPPSLLKCRSSSSRSKSSAVVKSPHRRARKNWLFLFWGDQMHFLRLF